MLRHATIVTQAIKNASRRSATVVFSSTSRVTTCVLPLASVAVSVTVATVVQSGQRSVTPSAGNTSTQMHQSAMSDPTRTAVVKNRWVCVLSCARFAISSTGKIGDGTPPSAAAGGSFAARIAAALACLSDAQLSSVDHQQPQKQRSQDHQKDDVENAEIHPPCQLNRGVVVTEKGKGSEC